MCVCTLKDLAASMIGSGDEFVKKMACNYTLGHTGSVQKEGPGDKVDVT